MRAIRWFIKKNQRLSALVRHALPSAWIGEDLKLVQDRRVPDFVHHAPGAVVVDVGGGRNCHFARSLKSNDATLVAADVSAEELQLNTDAGLRVAADAVEGLPFPPDAVDLIVTRSVMEHLRDVEGFLEQASTCLRPGGHFVSVFPCRFSPFSTINRMIPNRVAREILFYFHPASKGECGFRTFYDRMYYSKMRDLLEKHGFEIKEVRVRYFQSMYYDFFFPLFIASLAYDVLLYFLGARNLAAQLSFVAQKRSAPPAGPCVSPGGGSRRSRDVEQRPRPGVESDSWAPAYLFS